MPFGRCPICGGQLVGETENSCVAAAAALWVCAIPPTLRGAAAPQDTVRRFEETRDSGWRGRRSAEPKFYLNRAFSASFVCALCRVEANALGLTDFEPMGLSLEAVY